MECREEGALTAPTWCPLQSRVRYLVLDARPTTEGLAPTCLGRDRSLLRAIWGRKAQASMNVVAIAHRAWRRTARRKARSRTPRRKPRSFRRRSSSRDRLHAPEAGALARAARAPRPALRQAA